MKTSLKSYIMWLLALSFFAYQFIFRLVPGLIISDIRNKFAIDATAFGLLSSMYYFGYAGMQIPVAILLDKYGPKYVISASVAICSIANLAFILSDSWTIALLGRFIIGAGSAVGFLGVSKVISLYFPNKHYGRMVALSFTFGLLGALYGGRPLNSLIEISGWKNVLEIVSIIGLVLALLIMLFIKNPIIEEKSELEKNNIFQQLYKIISNRQIVILAFANLLMVGPLEGFADVWGISYLTKVYKLTKGDASIVTSSIFLGMIFGGPILNFIVDKFNNYANTLAVCGLIMGLIFISMLLGAKYFTYQNLYSMMFVMGIICCYQVVIFSFSKILVEPKLQGISIAFLNCINMLGGSFFHTTIGFVMDLTNDDISKNYSPESYLYALSVIPAACLIGGFMFLYLNYVTNKAKLNEAASLEAKNFLSTQA